MQRVLFESRLREIIFQDGTEVSIASVPWEVVEQAEPGEELDTVKLWARKVGLIHREDQLIPVMPVCA